MLPHFNQQYLDDLFVSTGDSPVKGRFLRAVALVYKAGSLVFALAQNVFENLGIAARSREVQQ